MARPWNFGEMRDPQTAVSWFKSCPRNQDLAAMSVKGPPPAGFFMCPNRFQAKAKNPKPSQLAIRIPPPISAGCLQIEFPTVTDCERHSKLASLIEVTVVHIDAWASCGSPQDRFFELCHENLALRGFDALCNLLYDCPRKLPYRGRRKQASHRNSNT
jgi:hypothetical protein